MSDPTTANVRLIALVGSLVMVMFTGASPVRAAPAPKPAELKHLCAAKKTGLVRPVTARSACAASERAFSLPAAAPLRLCTRSGGFVRRPDSAGRCLSNERRFALPGTGPTWFCVVPSVMWLHRVGSAAACGEDEKPLVVSVPVGGGDSYAVNEDATLAPAAPGVLADDTDARDPLKAQLVSGPAHASSFQLRADGSFTFKPRANYHGPDKFTYRATDGTYRSKVMTVAITIRPVNDPPKFTKGADQSVAEGSGAFAANGWATGISPGGPSNEATQALAFTLTPVDPSLFSAGPALSPAGRLSFTPAAGKSGSTTVSVVLEDNGGTANGGDDSSAPQTFTIAIVSTNGAPVANADSFAYTEDAAAAQDVPDVLQNDTDPDGDQLGATLVKGPEHAASFTLDADGSFAYKPEADFCGRTGSRTRPVTAPASRARRA